jgi:broad specificity phosphatase PhoE
MRQAEFLAERLRDYSIDVIYTSSLKRSFDTAGIIAKYHKETPLIDLEELNELHIGIFTGLHWSEVTEKYPDIVREFKSKRSFDCIPGAESSEEINGRVSKCLDMLMLQKDKSKRVLVVSHGSFLQRLIKKILGICDKSLVVFNLGNTSVTEISINDIIRVKKINCIAHLNL